MGTPNLLAILNELLGAEEELAIAYGQATVLFTQGVLTQDAVDRYTALRDQLFSDESDVYGLLQTLATPLGLSSRIPAPTRLPDLTANAGTTPVSAAGLGALPIAGWIALVIVVLAELAALAYVVVRFAEIGADLIARIYQIHTDARNYELQLGAVSARYNACLAAGRSPADCASSNPLPAPPMRPLQTTGDYVFEIAAVGGVMAGLGGLAWLAYKHRVS